MPVEITPDTNPLGLSDEDFLTLNAPPAAEFSTAGGDSGDQGDDSNKSNNLPNGDANGEDAANKDAAGADGANSDGKDGQDDLDDPEKKKDDKGSPSDKSGESGNLPKDKSQEPNSADKKLATAKVPDGKTEGKPAGSEGSQDDPNNPPGSKVENKQNEIPDYEGIYKKLMAPLKANGKTIEIKNPEEAVQLMQMGANYTRKMQALAPHRKYLLMLENNGLLDEGKLSYLIDLDKKNPEAIKKLIKDSGLDPREIDLDDPQAKPYLEGNHRVSEEETNFRTTLDELSSIPDGKATLIEINTNWDQASREVLWKQPDVMTLIHQQRESGIYDRITTELTRQRTLGQIPPNVPFLHAYKAIGDQLAAGNKFDDLIKAPEFKQQEQTPIVTRTQKPKPAVVNGDKANAASSTRATPRKVETSVNPLALSDDDFMKQVAQFEGRL